MAEPTAPRRLTIADISKMVAEQQPIVMMTAYDYPTAHFLDEAGVPIILVGDSLGMTALGYDTTIPVTAEDMITFTKPVVRGSSRALVVIDMPFLTFGISIEESVRNCGRLLQATGCQAVKLEGGASIAPTVRAVTEIGVPVMGHIGFTPQAVNQFGGYRVQGKTADRARRLIDDAVAMEEAGAFAIVLELVPTELSRAISERLTIPTLGVGAGPACDGVAIITNDVIGLTSRRIPRHARRYADAGQLIRDAATALVADVQAGVFPAEENSTHMDEAIVTEAVAAARSDLA